MSESIGSGDKKPDQDEVAPEGCELGDLLDTDQTLGLELERLLVGDWTPKPDK